MFCQAMHNAHVQSECLLAWEKSSHGAISEEEKKLLDVLNLGLAEF